MTTCNLGFFHTLAQIRCRKRFASCFSLDPLLLGEFCVQCLTFKEHFCKKKRCSAFQLWRLGELFVLCMRCHVGAE